MSTIVGQISTIKGCVRAIDPVTGHVRILEQGSPTFADEIIITSAVGGVLISLENGTKLTLGRDTQMRLDNDVISQASIIDSDTEGAVNIEALQQALLEGSFNSLEVTSASDEASQELTPETTAETIQETTKESAIDSGVVAEPIGSATEVTRRFDRNLAQIQVLDTKERVGIVTEPIAPKPIATELLATKAIVTSLALSTQSDMPEDVQITYGPIADATPTEDNSCESATIEADQLDESFLHDTAEDNLFTIESDIDQLSAASMNRNYSTHDPLDLSEVIDLEVEVDEAVLAQYLDFGFALVNAETDEVDNAAIADESPNPYFQDNKDTNNLNIDYQND